jgi:HD-like signal output (HDOD) protein
MTMRPQRPSSIAFDRLPRFPPAIARTLRHVRDPEISPDNLQALLAVDEDLAEGLVRAANLRFFGGRREVHTISGAIAGMGRDGFQELLFAAGALSLFREGISALDVRALRVHSLACGFLARDLSRRLRVGDPGMAFRAGAIHDIGFIAAGAGPRKASFRAASKAAESGQCLTRVEATMMGHDHCLLGRWYGERFDLEDPVLDAIGFHHDPRRAPSPREITALVGLGDHICRAAGAGYGFPEELGDGLLSRHPAWRILCEDRPEFDRIDPAAISAEAVGRLDEAREAAEELCEETIPA